MLSTTLFSFAMFITDRTCIVSVKVFKVMPEDYHRPMAFVLMVIPEWNSLLVNMLGHKINGLENITAWNLFKYGVFWSILSRIWTEYGDLRSKSPYSVQIRENTGQKTPYYDTFHALYFSLLSMYYSFSC